jgi:hypothetical protein
MVWIKPQKRHWLDSVFNSEFAYRPRQLDLSDLRKERACTKQIPKGRTPREGDIRSSSGPNLG